MHEQLGVGGQATVYRAMQRHTERAVAVKVYEKKAMLADPQQDLQEDLSLEIKLLRQLRHPHIVALLDVAADEYSVYLVQELLGGGELFDYLLVKGALAEPQALEIFAQLCLALHYLHGLAVAHRDIKTENIVFAVRDKPHVKLCDFGTADTWTAHEPLTGLVGTPHYMAPEIVRGWFSSEAEGLMATSEPYGLECDLWSMHASSWTRTCVYLSPYY